MTSLVPVLQGGKWSGEFSQSAESRWHSVVFVPDETRRHSGVPTQVSSHTQKHNRFISTKCFVCLFLQLFFFKSECKLIFSVHSVTRHLLSAGLDRRRQLGDIEFSNKYAEFLRSKAKHTSICSFLRRMQSVKMRCETWNPPSHQLPPTDCYSVNGGESLFLCLVFELNQTELKWFVFSTVASAETQRGWTCFCSSTCVHPSSTAGQVPFRRRQRDVPKKNKNKRHWAELVLPCLTWNHRFMYYY